MSSVVDWRLPHHVDLDVGHLRFHNCLCLLDQPAKLVRGGRRLGVGDEVEALSQAVGFEGQLLDVRVGALELEGREVNRELVRPCGRNWLCRLATARPFVPEWREFS